MPRSCGRPSSRSRIRRFYQHGAIDFRGTVRALVYNLEHKAVQGGSTLAQQYVKNVEILSSPNPDKAFASATADTVGRKIRELRMAVQVEHTMSKNDILAGYLNAAFFGNQSYGVQVAAQRYFSTSAAKLTLAQAAMLAGIVENPSQYNPLGTASRRLGHLEPAERRARADGPAALHLGRRSGSRGEQAARPEPVGTPVRVHQQVGEVRGVHV